MDDEALFIRLVWTVVISVASTLFLVSWFGGFKSVSDDNTSTVIENKIENSRSIETLQSEISQLEDELESVKQTADENYSAIDNLYYELGL